jgi:hypothetical protein
MSERAKPGNAAERIPVRRSTTRSARSLVRLAMARRRDGATDQPSTSRSTSRLNGALLFHIEPPGTNSGLRSVQA